MVRPLAVFSVASGLSLITLKVVASTSPSTTAALVAPLGYSFGGYDIAQLDVLEPTLYHIDQSYVERSRVDWQKMYDAGLEAVERRVPGCKFQRETDGDRLSVEVGDYSTILQISPSPISSQKQLRNELKKVAVILKEHLDPEDIPTNKPTDDPFAQVEYALVNGILSTLDPHSVLLPPVDSKNMEVENQGSFGGLGITITERDNRLTIEYPLSDTPAERAGLEPDDRILRIDGESTINMSLDEAVSRLRGRVGEPVTIEIMRDGLTEPMEVLIVRARIKLHPVEAAMLDGGYGYVKIKGFHQDVAAQLEDELTRLTRESGGLKGLVLDLRGNPGGYLNQAIKVSDTFLWEGTIVSTVDGQGRTRDREQAHSAGTQPRYPIVVITNANSASASEIVSGALRNNERAVIVGERTFGKGSVQNLHPYFDESRLKLTISKYLTPGERSIQSVGIPADIQLEPAVIRHDAEKPDEDYALMFWRERVRREADLDKHLERASVQVEEPSFSLRYLQPKNERKRSAKLDLDDYQIQFARDILIAAPSWRRAEILEAAAPVVERYRREGVTAITQAFDQLDIDWSPGVSPKQASLDVRLDLGEDGVLQAGKSEHINLEVTNTGDATLYQLAAVSNDKDLNMLNGREFFLGRLDPGQTRSYEQQVVLASGWPSEQVPVSFAFRDSGGKEVFTQTERVPVKGQPLPRLAWDWKISDGNSDGVADLDEPLTISLTITNEGEGPTTEAFARIRNRAGRALDISSGSLEPGEPQPKGDQDCSDSDTRCKRVLAPGASWTGDFEVQLTEAHEDGYDLELSLGDADAYDVASIARAGFYGYFVQKETVHLTLGEPLPTSTTRHTPVIEVTRSLPPQVSADQATISGVVTDDHGLHHVIVYAGGDKVFYQGAARDQGIRSMPFTADATLKPGVNTFTVLATDAEGFTATQSVVTWYVPPSSTAAVEK